MAHEKNPAIKELGMQAFKNLICGFMLFRCLPSLLD